MTPYAITGLQLIDAIKEAIIRLPESERHALSGWLNELEYDDWDKQMAADFSPGGRGMSLVETVRPDIAAGKATPFEHGREQAQAESNNLLR